MKNQNIVDRIIPLPQIIKVDNGITREKKRIAVTIGVKNTPKIETALELLNDICIESHNKADFHIVLSLINSKKDKKVEKGLKAAKNKNQAYSILPIVFKKEFLALEIKAYTDIGLLYGVRTLLQAIVIKGNEVYFPKIKVFDWPDIEFRGQWGGTSNCDIPYVSQYKYNAIDGKVYVNADKDGNALVIHNNRLYDQAIKYGVDIAATIPHLENVAKRGFLSDKKEMLSVPSEERKNRSDYYPGICMSHVETLAMITNWYEKIAENKKISKILVWLSEEETTCYCDKCNGKKPYILETECLLNAYNNIKVEYPYIKFGIMLSQGSFKDTKEIAAMLPKDVSLTYYDGGRTYDSGQYEMVLPVLNKYVQNGGLLGIYPQITHSWRTVFPMRSPYFIKYRCDEFVKKDLHRVIGYAVPDNRYHDYNLLAFLEWLWNSKGRSEKQFTYSYALINGLDKELYYEYIKALKQPSWDLAHSKLFVRLMYNYPLILRSTLEFDDHRFEMSEMLEIKNIKSDITKVKLAIDIAKKMKNKVLVYEANCIYGGLIAYNAITSFIKEIDKKAIDTTKLIKWYEDTKKASNIVYKNILKWSKEILTEDEKHHVRVTDTSVVLFRALDGMKKYFDETNIKIENDNQRIIHVGEWDESLFENKDNTILKYDVSEILKKNKKGTYHMSLDYIKSQSGTEIVRAFIREVQKAGGEKTTSQVRVNMKRVSIWAPWAEYIIKVNKVKQECKYILCLDVKGMEKGEKTCKGMLGLRKVK